MKKQIVNILYLTFIFLFVAACDSNPRVIESESTSNDANNIPPFNDAPSMDAVTSEQHKVVVNEILNTDKYSYLNVTENDKNFWLAVTKLEAKAGDTFYYTGGLLKKNFQSREFDRVFETVYLVSNIWKEPAATTDDSALDEAFAKMQDGGEVDLKVGNIQPAEGAIKISELIANKEKYNGKLVKITGKCVKVNPMIMKRNWVHIKDSSDGEIDLTVTTAENIPLGAVVSLEGIIALDRDFGAGYRYDIIMEGAVLR